MSSFLLAACAARNPAPTAATSTVVATAPTEPAPAPSAEPSPEPEPEPEREPSLVVDHAWVKDTAKPNGNKRHRLLLDKLRAKVAAGATIPEAFAALKIPGTDWHIGDHEEYPFSVLPESVRALDVGAISPVIAGDGGLHLFKVYERRFAK